MELIKLVDVCRVKFKDGRIFFIPENQMDAFIAMREKNSMVKINGNYYDKFLVEEVGIKKIDEDTLKLNEEQRIALETHTKHYIKGLGKFPSDYTRSKWAQKIHKGERILMNF